MFRARWLLGALMIGLVLAPPVARARTMGVDIWTDRGKDAVYEPGEPVEIKVRGYNLTLRKHEAEQILVRPSP